MKFGYFVCTGMLCLLVSSPLSSQNNPASSSSALVEICDNQLDDDNDGYIDCYDSDCACFPTVNCTAPAGLGGIQARLAWQSGINGVSVTATPIVANMNPQVDAIAEIIIAEAAPSDTLLFERLLFFKGDGSNADAPYALKIPSGLDFFPVPAPVVGDVNKDGIPELIVICNDTRIRVYSNYTEDLDNPMTLWITASGFVDFPDQKPYLADFDHDGTPEVYAGNNIFKFDFSNPANPTLNKILGGPGYKAHCSYFNYVEGSASPVAVNLLKPNECLGDPDCDGLELAAGPVIYSVDIKLDFDGYELEVQRNLHNFDPMNTYADGYTSVADVNLDGVPELVVAAKRNADEYGVYVWNKYGLVRFMPYPLKSQLSGSLPCIANVFDDRTAGFTKDFPEIIVACKSQLVCFNLQAAQKDPNYPYWWVLDIVDLSSFTSCAAFDLNGDGVQELIYRDEAFLRILYGGALPFPAGVDAERHWAKIPCGSVTSDEYPVVADVDNDGASEIVVSGFTFSGFNNPIDDYRGRLRVFKSDGAPWLPSRQVWNQFGYFGMNVNDDLTIPQQQQAHHLEFPGPGSGKRPFNNFLAQLPVLNADFEPFLPAPDAYAEVKNVGCDSGSTVLELQVCNAGSQTLPAGTPIAFYLGDPTAGNVPLVGDPKLTPVAVPADSCRSFVFQIPKTNGTVFGVLNDNGTLATPFDLIMSFPVTNQNECVWTNNLFSFEQDSTAPPPQEPALRIQTCGDSTFMLSARGASASYLWQDGSTDSLYQVQAPGVYWVDYADVCYGPRRDSFLVEFLDLPQLELTAVQGDCFGTPASASVSGTSGYPPLSFKWSDGSTEDSITVVTDGVYEVTVTDAKGCSAAGSIQVDAGGNLQVMPEVAAIPCAGDTGAIDLEIQVGRAPFSYAWADGSSAANRSGLLAGTYAVTVTDADGCSQALAIELTEPLPLTSQGIDAQPSCPDDATGTVGLLSVVQGTPPYSFKWSNGNSDSSQANLAGGIYTVTITDANGCTAVASDTVSIFEKPVLQETVQHISCFGAADGGVSIALLNPVPDITYSWTTGATGPDIQNLPPGNYGLLVRFGNGACVLPPLDFQLTEPEPLELQTEATNPVCHAGTDGSIDLATNGGTAPYTYAWSNGATTEDLTFLTAGTYTLLLTDANGCADTLQISLTDPLPLLSAGFETQSACPGTPSGSAVFLGASQGLEPYALLWSTGAVSDSLLAVSPGTYTLIITDSNGCSLVDTAIVPETASLSLDTIQDQVSCFGAADGRAGVIEQSGATGVLYAWSTNASTPVIQNLPPGPYTLTITFGDGLCTQELAFQISEPAPLTVQTAITADPVCHAGMDGSIDLATNGGTAPYTYAWSNGATTEDLTFLTAGTYTLLLTDANGCTETLQASLTDPLPLLSAGFETQSACPGTPSGSAVFLGASQGLEPYALLWSTGAVSDSLLAVSPGTYTLIITDSNGCSLVDTAIVPETASLSLDTIQDQVSCFGAADGRAGVIEQSGATGVLYAWSTNASTPVIQNLLPGPYTVTITFGDGLCTQELAFQISEPAPLTAQTTIAADTCNRSTGSIEVAASDGTPPFVYQWNNGGNNPVLQNLQAGVFSVTITDANACTIEVEQEVLAWGVAPQFDLFSDTISCAEPSAGIGLVAYQADWQFDWSGPAGALPNQAVQQVSVPGTYQVLVTNSYGCTASDEVWVVEIAGPQGTVQADSISCFGYSDGRITIQYTGGGTPPVLYSIDQVNYSADNVFSNLAPSTYKVSIQDAEGCIWDTEVNLAEPDIFSVSLSASTAVAAPGETVELTATLNPPDFQPVEITWAPAGFGFVPMALEQQVAVTEPVEFEVLVSDKNGCTASDRVFIQVDEAVEVYVPNALKPGSVQNGVFTVFAGPTVQKISLLRVFDRWGDLVFEKQEFAPNDPSTGWDGTFNSEVLNPGVYVWYAELELQDGSRVIKKGSVLLVR